MHEQQLFKRFQILNLDETETLEFKNYWYPFSYEIINRLKITVNAFLNNKGGRIYNGIKDENC